MQKKVISLSPTDPATTIIKPDLSNLAEIFKHLPPEQRGPAQTKFLQKLALALHKHYAGKTTTLPKVPISLGLLSVWYTPGVASVSRTIKANQTASLDLTARGNTVAVISDSTRVLGDGDCGPAGGIAVMEGKALLMQYLAGLNATALCMDSKTDGHADPKNIIDYVRRSAPSFGAVNLEDISSPNCYRVLDALRKDCTIPVWHDDAQGTASVTLAALFNALELADKKIEDAKIVFLGAGAANTSAVSLIQQAGGDFHKMIVFDSKGGLHSGRLEEGSEHKILTDDTRPDYDPRKHKICQQTNPSKIDTMEEAIKGAAVLIALSTPGPTTIKPEWIGKMADKRIVFACANPVPEIYPEAAKKAGAFIVATGRGDFANQVNNSLCFPGLLKGTLLIRANKITDNMAIAAARTIADFAKKQRISSERIVPTMDQWELYPEIAAAVAAQAIEDGVVTLVPGDEGTPQPIRTPDQVRVKARADIEQVRDWHQALAIPDPPQDLIDQALATTLPSSKHRDKKRRTE
jgi:malate dehydrogenase (oxaloacetate-decarboxylating)